MSLFSSADIAKINKTAKQSTKLIDPKAKSTKSNKSITSQLEQIYANLTKYFADSQAILIKDEQQLDEYIDKAIDEVYVGIDTETTGLDRQKDHIVGMSLYFMNGTECYMPNKHLVPIFDEPYSGQLTYSQCAKALEKMKAGGVKFIFANADFDLSMIYKDYEVDLLPNFYADVILAWRCLKEDELDNKLKSLYHKYVEKGKGDPMQFSDFFSPEVFPYSKPEMAALYAANDAKITLKLFLYELQFLNKKYEKCQKHNLQRVADLYWNLEIPMVTICQLLHRNGIYIDNDTCQALKERYTHILKEETDKLSNMVQDILDSSSYVTGLAKRPFVSGKEFNPKSAPHVKYLLYTVMNLPTSSKGQSTDKEVLAEINLPITKQILKVRSINVLISTFVDKLPNSAGKDNRIHAQFKQVGASTGRMCIAKGTKITMKHGYKLIENIVPGDIIYCYNEEAHQVVLSKVKNLWFTGKDKKCVKIKWTVSNTDDIKELICTPEHPILTKSSSWVRADSITPKTNIVPLSRNTHTTKNELDNDILIIHNHQVLSVEAAGKHDVYDIEVETYHNFIANEVCVHNSSADPNLQNIPSHALDIRHMFRATPEMNEDIKYNSELNIRIHDSLETENGWKYGDEITQNDIILDTSLNKHNVLRILINGGDVKLKLSDTNDNTIFTLKHSAYVMLSSDYSQQEPKLTAFVSKDKGMIQAFKDGKDIYATIASLSFNLPYEKCLEFHPETGEYQPDGKARRGEAKSIVLGITYGRSVVTIAEQLFGEDDTISESDKIKKAQKIYDAVLNAFPGIRNIMLNTQNMARKLGYVESILGRRRHIPDMQLPEFEFKPMPGYVNPDIDPLDVTTLVNQSDIPERIIKQLEKEFKSYKYFGQIVKRINELAEQKIKVVNNRRKIDDATRKCLNSVVQGSAAEQTKLALLKIHRNKRWHEIGGRLLVPVHDEIIAEVPMRYWQEGGELLSKMMCDAADFLPFASKCDVTTTLRWYGLEYPCKYSKPENFDNMTEDNIKWLQYHLYECEYTLPIYKENDEKPRGDAAYGVNGIYSDECKQCVDSYMKKYKLKDNNQFLKHIHNRVYYGVTKI